MAADAAAAEDAVFTGCWICRRRRRAAAVRLIQRASLRFLSLHTVD